MCPSSPFLVRYFYLFFSRCVADRQVTLAKLAELGSVRFRAEVRELQRAVDGSAAYANDAELTSLTGYAQGVALKRRLDVNYTHMTHLRDWRRGDCRHRAPEGLTGTTYASRPPAHACTRAV